VAEMKGGVDVCCFFELSSDYLIVSCETSFEKEQAAALPLTLSTAMANPPTTPSHHHQQCPRLRQGYPLDLSILLSGGKETNKDPLSNGE